MILPSVRNRFSANPSTVMIPVHLKLPQYVIDLLETAAEKHGFDRIQSLIRFYVKQGLSEEDNGYVFSDDTHFIDELKRQGVSDDVIEQAIAAANTLHRPKQSAKP